MKWSVVGRAVYDWLISGVHSNGYVCACVCPCVCACVCACVFPSPPSYLYQIAHLGDNDDEPEFSSAMQLEEGETFFFAPRALRNLVQVDEMESLSPMLTCQVIICTSIRIIRVNVPSPFAPAGGEV